MVHIENKKVKISDNTTKHFNYQTRNRTYNNRNGRLEAIFITEVKQRNKKLNKNWYDDIKNTRHMYPVNQRYGPPT